MTGKLLGKINRICRREKRKKLKKAWATREASGFGTVNYQNTVIQIPGDDLQPSNFHAN